MNCIGLDVHCETVEMSVVREGQEIFKVQVPTEEVTGPRFCTK